MPDDDEPSEVDRTDPVLLGIEGTRRIFTGDYEEAVEMLREAAAMPHDDHERGLTHNNLAWALLLSRPEGWLEEADRACSEAIRLAPDVTAVDSTRHHLFLAEHRMSNLYGAGAALLAWSATGAAPEVVAQARLMFRPHEVDHVMENMLGADGAILWPEMRRGDDMSRHIEEIRAAVTAFVENPLRGCAGRVSGSLHTGIDALIGPGLGKRDSPRNGRMRYMAFVAEAGSFRAWVPSGRRSPRLARARPSRDGW